MDRISPLVRQRSETGNGKPRAHTPPRVDEFSRLRISGLKRTAAGRELLRQSNDVNRLEAGVLLGAPDEVETMRGIAENRVQNQ